MADSIDPKLMSAESERMHDVLQRLEEFMSAPADAVVKLPRLGDGAIDQATPAQEEGVATCPNH